GGDERDFEGLAEEGEHERAPLVERGWGSAARRPAPGARWETRPRPCAPELPFREYPRVRGGKGRPTPCPSPARPTLPVLTDPTTRFVRRLRSGEPAAWFELWENFGPVLRAQLAKWGKGAIGPETVKDLSQETLAALSDAIDRHDPGKGARFSTWLLAIAH